MTLDDVARALKRRHAPLESPYFSALRDGSMSREAFVASQVQFGVAVGNFWKPMQALAARATTAPMREMLLANIADELGRGDRAQSHEATFARFLDALGAPVAPPGPAVLAFNEVLASVCERGEVPRALATLGMIEDLFAAISAEIGRAVIARGWLTAERLVHYRTHEALDGVHAEGFYAQLREGFAAGGRARSLIEEGLELGATSFLALYRGLAARP